MSIKKGWRTGAQVTHGWTIEAKLAYWSDRAPRGCLEWQGTTNKRGYGRLLHEGRMRLAHRAAYEALHGPTVLHVLHDCDNPRCIEPAHLYHGTDADNHADMVERGRCVKEQPKIRGELHAASKLTAEQVLAIRANPWPQRVIAEAYGISQTRVGQIIRREAWSHLP